MYIHYCFNFFSLFFKKTQTQGPETTTISRSLTTTFSEIAALTFSKYTVKFVSTLFKKKNNNN